MVSIVSEKGEIWKKVVQNGVERNRLISNFGNVVNTESGIRCGINDNGNGYKVVNIHNLLHENKRIEYVHRLVARHFLPNPYNLPQVNHLDCDKSNNKVDNLAWVSGSDNILDAHKKGRMSKRSAYGPIKYLTKEQVIDLYTSVKLYGIGISVKAREMGISRTTASSIINKRSRSDITDILDVEFSNAEIH